MLAAGGIGASDIASPRLLLADAIACWCFFGIAGTPSGIN